MAEETKLPYDASDPAQVKKRKTKEQLRKDQQDADLCSVLSTQAGMRFMWRLMGECGIHETSFHTNALVMAQKEGRRSIGLLLELNIAQACPNKFLEMQLLNSKEEANG